MKYFFIITLLLLSISGYGQSKFDTVRVTDLQGTTGKNHTHQWVAQVVNANPTASFPRQKSSTGKLVKRRICKTCYIQEDIWERAESPQKVPLPNVDTSILDEYGKIKLRRLLELAN